MGQFLDRLLEGSAAYGVRRENDGYLLTGHDAHLDQFSDLVREAATKSGDEFVVFAFTDGRQGYSQMFVLPLDDNHAPG